MAPIVSVYLLKAGCRQAHAGGVEIFPPAGPEHINISVYIGSNFLTMQKKLCPVQ
jgi:hypothetical protein